MSQFYSYLTILIILHTLRDLSGAVHCVGCLSEVDPNDAELKKKLQEVIEEKNKELSEGMALVLISKASSQIVAGIKYVVDFEAVGDTKKELYSCHTEFVSRPWLNLKLQILNYSCVKKLEYLNILII